MSTNDPTSAPSSVSVTVNGDERHVADGRTITEFLAEFDLVPGMVVVELNREILPRDQFGETVVREGDRIELVHFVGGG